MVDSFQEKVSITAPDVTTFTIYLNYIPKCSDHSGFTDFNDRDLVTNISEAHLHTVPGGATLTH